LSQKPERERKAEREKEKERGKKLVGCLCAIIEKI
jgi:hypothetical protein